MKECHSFSFNCRQKFVTINVVRGSNPSGAWPAADPVLLLHVLTGPSEQRTPLDRARSAVGWKRVFASEQRGRGNGTMQVEEFFFFYFFLIFVLTGFEMQDLYTYISMAYKEFKMHITSSM